MADLRISPRNQNPQERSRTNEIDRQELFSILYERSFLYRPENPFTLSSGKVSPVYLDGKKTTLGHPRAQFLIGSIIFDLIESIHPDGVGGLTLGADPISVAVSLVSGLHQCPIPSFVVRKEQKGHGTKSPIEGDLPSRARVVVVEDVVTTGGSGMKAIEACQNAGYDVLRVIALVDRQEGGRELFESARIPFTALFTLKRFIEYDGEVRGGR